MTQSLRDVIDSYDPGSTLDHAFTIPGSWYIDQKLYELELKTVFSNTWQYAARKDQLTQPGQFVTTDIGDEPVVVVRGNDDVLRAFFNVCRHHAAAVMTEPEGRVNQLRCPYHGWTYSLAGELKGTPDFSEVCDFDRAANGLVPIDVVVWGNWGFPNLDSEHLKNSSATLENFLGTDLIGQIQPLSLQNLHWAE